MNVAIELGYNNWIMITLKLIFYHNNMQYIGSCYVHNFSDFELWTAPKVRDELTIV